MKRSKGRLTSLRSSTSPNRRSRLLKRAKRLRIQSSSNRHLSTPRRTTSPFKSQKRIRKSTNRSKSLRINLNILNLLFMKRKKKSCLSRNQRVSAQFKRRSLWSSLSQSRKFPKMLSRSNNLQKPPCRQLSSKRSQSRRKNKNSRFKRKMRHKWKRHQL